MWGVGILTWNDPATCQRTLAAIHARLDVPAQTTILVLDNGSDVPLSLDSPGPVEIVRHPHNLGAGGGVSAVITDLLDRGADHLLFLEDDWELIRPLALIDLEPLLAAVDIGQIRLGLRPTRPASKYYTYGLDGADATIAAEFVNVEHLHYASGSYQRIRSLWSNNPFACRREIAERFLLTGLDELRMARPYYASGLITLSTTPGHFRHLGTIRDRREKAGWTK